MKTMIKLYFIKKPGKVIMRLNEKGKYSCNPGDEDNVMHILGDELLWDNKTEAEEYVKRIADLYNYEIDYIEVDDKCKCSNYIQTTMIVLEKKDSEIIFKGSSNYLGIHNLFGLPFFIDIEKWSDGKYFVVSKEYFDKHCKIIGKEV